MGVDDAQRIEEIRNERLHRLRLLEKRQAIEGFRTPPEVITEITKTRYELGMAESIINHPADVETVEAMGAGGRWLATDRKLDLIVKMLTERMDRMEEHSQERYEAQEKKHDTGAALYRGWLTSISFAVIIALILCAFLIGGAFK